MSTNLDLLNYCANHPDVKPWVLPGVEEWVSLDRFFDNDKNVMLGDERGVVLFQYLRPGVFEGHYMLTKALRGRDAIGACRVALNAMFTAYGAETILGFVPRQNRACRAISCALGFQHIGPVSIRDVLYMFYSMRREDYELHWRSDRRFRAANGG